MGAHTLPEPGSAPRTRRHADGAGRLFARGGDFPTREAILLGLLLCGLVLALLLVIWLGERGLTGIRAFVHGEAIYSRSQKDAVFALQRYAITTDEADWRRYEEAMALPLAGGRAWRLLTSEDPDPDTVRAAIREAGHHPEDVGPVMWLFPFARWGREMQAAIEVGMETDTLVRRLDATARLLRAEVRGPGWSADRAMALLTGVYEINTTLSHLEDEFSDLMAAGTRRVSKWVLAGTSGAAFLLLGLGAAGSARLLRRMRRRENQFRSIIENTSDLVSILDLDARVLYQSPAVERMLGYGRDELVGRAGFEMIHPDDRPALERELIEHLQDPLRTQRASEYRSRHADGSWRTLASTAGVYEDEQGERRIIVTSRDITLQRELELRLARTSRLESVGRLAGGISHDFNNLLTAILGAAESARHTLPAESPAQAEMAEIIDATARAADLTRQLLAFARRQPVEPVVFDLGEDLREMEPILRRLLGADIRLSVGTEGAPARVRADRSQIERVVLNLVVNARDAMPDGGALRISLERRPLDRETAERETAGDPGPFIVLEVADTGVAMEPDVLERIFEPFFSTKDTSQGTGLGLATTYGIVRQSGGFLTVTSERGRGSCFRVHLPECGGAATEPFAAREHTHDAPSDRARRDPRGAETLLLVEDQPDVRRVTGRALRARGYAVVEMGDGAEALRWSAEHLDDVDGIVTDVVMPRVSGPALVARLREQRPELPAVFISGDPAEGGALARAPRTRLLQKPVPADVLARNVRTLLDAAADTGGARRRHGHLRAVE